MSHVLIRHKVADYGQWKPAYDAHAQARKAAGCTGDLVMRDEDDPNMVTVLLDWNTPSAAHAFAASADLKKVMQKAGVQGAPEIRFLNDPPPMTM